MIAFDFAAALAPGTTFVTPNKRLARHLISCYDNAQIAAGRRAWVAGRAMPWPSWLQALWLDALAADALTAPRILVGPGAAAHLWDRIVAQESSGLLDARGAAAQAAEAWSLFHAWRLPDDRFDGWSRAGIGDDAATFARWAQRYRTALAESGMVDTAQSVGGTTEAATTAVDQEAMRIATRFLQGQGVDWGRPSLVERTSGGWYCVEFDYRKADSWDLDGALLVDPNTGNVELPLRR